MAKLIVYVTSPVQVYASLQSSSGAVTQDGNVGGASVELWTGKGIDKVRRKCWWGVHGAVDYGKGIDKVYWVN